MTTIKITCENCGMAHEVKRTSEIPAWVISMGCNWCPNKDCHASEDYEEWYNPKNEGEYFPTEPIPVSDNQLTMPFIFDELEIPQLQPEKIF